jgi:hypothetical protein
VEDKGEVVTMHVLRNMGVVDVSSPILVLALDGRRVVTFPLWPLYSREKRPPLLAKESLCGLQIRYRFGEEKNLLFLPGVEPLHFGCPARSLVTVQTELTQYPNCVE